MEFMRKKKLIFLILMAVCFHAKGQRTAVYTDPDREYRLARELFTKEKYSAALERFQHFISEGKGTELNLINAKYYSGLCAAELFHPDAEKRLVEFTEQHPENAYAKAAGFHLGRIYYKSKKYGKAIEWFEKTDVSFLSNEEIAEYYFKLGYSCFQKGEMEKASKAFREILNTESKYKTAANYYYAHVAYANNNYSTALSTFEKLKDSETFGPVIPYYIVQIYFEQQKYDEVIAYAVPKLSQGNLRNSVEIGRIVGECYYRKGNWKEAFKYLEDYIKNFPQPSREDYYQLAYCSYRLQQCDKAVTYFEKVVNVKDAIAQNAYYHLGGCFVILKNKQSARNAFQFAAQMDFDKSVKEDALFNYAKLSLELNFQSVAVNALRDYIKQFPGTAKADEANELLAQAYLSTRNYKDALAALESISNKTPRAAKAYQKVAYYRGVEFFNDRNYQAAIDLFTKAIVSDYDARVRALAMFWKAESFYALGRYQDAVKQYRIFIFNPPSINTPVYNLANYGLGYAHFKLENYREASDWFRKYIRNKAETDIARYNDALIRIADALFMEKEYINAVAFYDEAIAAKASGADYALFQKAMIQGIQGNLNAKATTLQTLLTVYSKSAYADDAVFERGNAFLSLGDNRKAEEQFKQLLSAYPQSVYVPKAKLNLALILYNENKDDQALTAYKKVVSEHPGTAEAASALVSIKNIYVSQGNAEGYFNYIKSIPFADVSVAEQEKIIYDAAEQVYLKGDFEKASRDFDNYLKQYPNGANAIAATFYKAESDFRLKRFEEALKGYESVLAAPKGNFSERSLLRAAGIYFDKKDYEKAAELYARLEETAAFKDNVIAAQAGLMRCHFLTGKFNSAGISAQKVMAQEKAPASLISEARMIYAKTLLESRDYTAALDEFKTLVKTASGETGAEARYYIAWIYFQQANYKESQKRCFDVINQVPSYDFWVAKSFILLSDNYVALKDVFQAKHTLKSILDNYEKNPSDPEDIISIAQQKYDALLKTENEKAIQEMREKQDKSINEPEE
jgi:TolA-binding protein